MKTTHIRDLKIKTMESVKEKKELQSDITKSFSYSFGEVNLNFSLTKSQESDFLICLKKAVQDVEKSINEK